MYRKSYALVDKQILRDNIKEIRKKYPSYEYYFGVVKNNAYHHGIGCVSALLEGGINYLAVSSLEEALEIRELYADIPILVLEPIPLEYVLLASEHQITLTVDNLEYVSKLVKQKFKEKLYLHLKLDTGMNRLGFKDNLELKEAYALLKEKKDIFVEGIYTHFATSGRGDVFYQKQLDRLQDFFSVLDWKEIPIRHFDRSITFVSHEKISWANGVRLGIMMYGFSESVIPSYKGLRNRLRLWRNQQYVKKGLMHEYTLANDLQLQTAYSLYASIISVRPVHVGERVGYNASYEVTEEGYIGTVAIGYADGVTKDFRSVYFNGKKLPIVSDSMDMIMIFCKEKLPLFSEVEILGEHMPIKRTSRLLGTNSYHLFNQISHRVPIIYKE